MAADRRTRLRLVAVAYFVMSTVVLVAPVYPAWGNAIEPRVLGLPWSLVSVLLVIAANFGVLAWLYAARIVDDEPEARS